MHPVNTWLITNLEAPTTLHQFDVPVQKVPEPDAAVNHKEHEAHERLHKDDLGFDSPDLFRPGFANRYGEEIGWLKMKSLWFPCVPCAAKN